MGGETPGSPADIDWSGTTTIRSRRFDDIYFSDADGLAETRHVFLEGNGLPARLTAVAEGEIFSVGELGFGTGLNLLALWHLWQARKTGTGHLHFLSVEGFPLSAEEFAEAHTRIATLWPELAPLSRALVRHYPEPLAGVHVVHLAEDVTLTLMIGDAADTLSQMTGIMDAWFLDGFSPAKNPAMWSEEVLAEVARLTGKGGTAATFTVAGAVRRGLETAGFSIEKTPGFGRKREMLRAAKTGAPELPETDKPWFSLANLKKSGGRQKITIAGAGIAGASAAWHLKRLGHEVALFDREGPAAGASGNPAGLIMPRLDLGATPEAAFYKAAFLHAVRFIEELEETAGTEIFTSRGGIMLARTEEESARHDRLATSGILPENLMRLISSDEAVSLAGISLSLNDPYRHLYFPGAGTISPAAYIDALLKNIPVRQGRFISYDSEDKVSSRFETPDGPAEITSDHLVIATALDAATHLTGNALTGSRGQIDFVDLPPPKLALSFGHYAAPCGGRMITGATYTPRETDTDGVWSAVDRAENLVALEKLIPAAVGAATTGKGRAALRCVTPDRHPVAGPLPDAAFFETEYQGLRTGKKNRTKPAEYQPGVFALTGLGSRGLVTAPLLAAAVTAEITGGPAPLPRDQQDMLHPARFLIRQLKRNERG